jgi:MtrB/PioB family decaheme-associated outer membrane protein
MSHPAWADDAVKLRELIFPASHIEIGYGNANGELFLPAHLNGLRRDWALLAFDWRRPIVRLGNPDDDGIRWRLAARMAGDAKAMTGEYGKQNAYRVSFALQALPVRVSDSFHTPLIGAGGARLRLPDGFVRGADTRDMSGLTNALRRTLIGSTVHRNDVAAEFTLDADWELSARVQKVAQGGSRLRGAAWGPSAATARALVVPEPLDHDTVNIDLALTYSGEDERVSFTYFGSLFRNRIDGIHVDNPYSSTPWTGGTTGLPRGFPLGEGRLGSAPDNAFHQIGANGNIDFSNTTRLAFALQKGRGTQNDTFLPYTVNPGLASLRLPRTSLDGRVDQTFASMRLTLRPQRSLHLTAALRYEDKDNATPRAQYVYVGGDAQRQPAADAASDRVRSNFARDKRQVVVSFDADVRLPQGFNFKGGFEHEHVERTGTEVDATRENTLRVEVRRLASTPWFGKAAFAMAERRGSPYRPNAPFLEGYSSPSFIAALAATTSCLELVECLRPGPLVRKFYLADRNRARGSVLFGWMDGSPWSALARADLTRDHYPDTPYGLKDAATTSGNVEINVAPSDSFRANVWTSHERQRRFQRARQIIGFTPLPTPTDADWTHRAREYTTSAGLGAHWVGLLGRRLDIDIDLVASRSRLPDATQTGAGLATALPLPDAVTRSFETRMGLRYRIDRSSNVSMGIGARRTRGFDWGLAGVNANTLPSTIGTLQTVAAPRASTITLTYTRSFR